MDAKDSGCLAVILMVSLQHAVNIVFFQLLQGFPPTNPGTVLNRCRPNRLGQILGGDDGMRSQGNGSLNHMLEFTDIAGPCIACQQRNGVRCEAGHRFLLGPTEFIDEIPTEQRNVFYSITQRRKDDGDDFQSVQKILSKCPGRDERF